MNAIFFSAVGIVMTLGIGTYFLDLPADLLLITCATAILANFVALLSSLQAEASRVFSRFLGSTPKIWLFFWIIFHGIILLLCPWMRDVKILLALWFPLFWSGALAAIPFGPIQDRIVWRRQHRERSMKL